MVPQNKPTYDFDANATYVISGGLGGLGRSTARWMASRGAKHLLLLSRFGPVHDSAKELLADLGALGVDVFAPPCDVSDEFALKRVLDECSSRMPSIRGCIQGSMVLKVSHCLLNLMFVISANPFLTGFYLCQYEP